MHVMQVSTVAVAVTHSNNRTSQKLNTLETPQEYLYFNLHIVVVGECMVIEPFMSMLDTHRVNEDVIRHHQTDRIYMFIVSNSSVSVLEICT